MQTAFECVIVTLEVIKIKMFCCILYTTCRRQYALNIDKKQRKYPSTMERTLVKLAEFVAIPFPK